MYQLISDKQTGEFEATLLHMLNDASRPIAILSAPEDLRSGDVVVLLREVSDADLVIMSDALHGILRRDEIRCEIDSAMFDDAEEEDDDDSDP